MDGLGSYLMLCDVLLIALFYDFLFSLLTPLDLLSLMAGDSLLPFTTHLKLLLFQLPFPTELLLSIQVVLLHLPSMPLY